MLHGIVRYPRTDDAEVTANFIGIAPVVEGPVVQLPIHDNDLVRKGDLLYKIDDRPYLYALQNALAAQAELEGEIENESRRISSQVNGVDVANAGEQSAVANETRAADEIEVAEAAIARSEGALKQAQADESYAIGNFHRIEPLLAKGFVTEDDVHKARTSADAKTAAVDQAKSQLQLAKASLLAALLKSSRQRRKFRRAEPRSKNRHIRFWFWRLCLPSARAGLPRFGLLGTTMSNATWWRHSMPALPISPHPKGNT